MDYTKIAKEMAESKDPGGELIKLLSELQLYENPGILIVQAIPDKGAGNPLVGITVFTNTGTDFPLDTEEEYLHWVEDYLVWLREQVAE